jgi:hypothetical protein
VTGAHRHRVPIVTLRPLTLALALLAGLPGAACAPGDDGAGRDDGAAPAGAPATPLLVVGDSLTVGARLWGDLGDGLAADGWDAEVVAENGRDVRWGLAQVTARAAVPPIVVVGLGTNPGRAPDAFAADAGELVAQLVARGARTVVWWPPVPLVEDGRAARAAALRAAAGGPLVVPDWSARVTAHPEWLDVDGVHYTDAGYAGLTAFLRTQLAAVRP